MSLQLCSAQDRILSQDFIPSLWSDQAQGYKNTISPNFQVVEGSVYKQAHLLINKILLSDWHTDTFLALNFCGEHPFKGPTCSQGL